MILAVREIGTDTDSRLSPAPSSDPDSWLIEREAYDGNRPVLLSITGLHEQEVVSGGAKTLTRLSGINGVVYITDSRVAVAVEKFDKGKRYWGIGAGAAVALVATGVSAARAAHRRKGKVLVGHVRYQWLKYVAASHRQGARGNNDISVGCDVKTAGGTRTYRLYITLAQVNPLDAAQDIIHRAAQYRLSYFPGNLEHHDRLRELTEAPALPAPEPKKMASYVMPNYFFVNNKTAYPEAAPASDS
jgi:hypothetical protein